MTQAYNLSQLANNLNTAGQLDATDGLVNAVPAANGGTGQSVYAVGDVLYASTTTALAKLPDVATGNVLISGGIGAAPSYGKVGLTTHVNGTLPIANGGTNSTASPTVGGVVYGTGTAYAITAAGSAGQILTSTGGSAPQWASVNAITLGTSQATTSGTIFTFTSIPSGVKRITMMLAGVSTSGTSIPQVRIGPSGGLETTGYVGETGAFNNVSTGLLNSTVGIPLTNAYAGNQTFHGAITCTLVNSSTNTWSIVAILGQPAGLMNFLGFTKSLAGVLTQISLSTQNGTDTFNAGSVNIQYE